MKIPKWLLLEINLFLSLGFVIFVVCELVFPGSVFSLFNLNYWLIALVVNAILIVFLK